MPKNYQTVSEGLFSEVRSAPVQQLSATRDENGGLPAFAPSISSGQYLHQLLRYSRLRRSSAALVGIEPAA